MWDIQQIEDCCRRDLGMAVPSRLRTTEDFILLPGMQDILQRLWNFDSF